MRISSANNNNRASFGAVKVRCVENPEATKVCKKIIGLFHPKGTPHKGQVTMFFANSEQDDMARQLLENNNIIHIHIPDEYLKTDADKELFSQIEIFG